MEKQHLQLIKDDSGAVVEAVLTTQPSIASVPVMGTISMGTVVIHVCSEPGFDGCVVSPLSLRTAFPAPRCPVLLSQVRSAPVRVRYVYILAASLVLLSRLCRKAGSVHCGKLHACGNLRRQRAPMLQAMLSSSSCHAGAHAPGLQREGTGVAVVGEELCGGDDADQCQAGRPALRRVHR